MYIKVGDPALAQFFGAIFYHESKVAKGEAERLLDTTYEEDATKKAQYLYDVAVQNQHVTTNRGFDISVNFHPEESISSEEMNLLGQEVMNELKFKNCPFVIYRHFDKPHSHFHIVVTSVDLAAVKIPEFQIRHRAKTTAIKLEKKYSLRQTERSNSQSLGKDYMVENYSVAKAAVKFEGKQVIDGISPEDLKDKSIAQIRKQYGSDRLQEIRAVMERRGLITVSEQQQLIKSLDRYKSITYSVEGYIKALENDGFYVRKIHNDKLIYRAPEGKHYFDDYKLGKQYTFSGLNDQFVSRRGAGKKNAVDPFTKRITARVLKESKSMDAFVSSCMEKGVLVQFTTYKDGRAYGISYTNISSGEVLKGSQVGLPLDKLLKKLQPKAELKNQKPIFYPSTMKKAQRMAGKLGYLLSKKEEEDREKRR